ncbi:hypothetical protein K439DRAFT_1619826 [Ramaria rubella]|nr:hypothetical protein K439DRAFT_1619826 [Ramaria rubella]
MHHCLVEPHRSYLNRACITTKGLWPLQAAGKDNKPKLLIPKVDPGRVFRHTVHGKDWSEGKVMAYALVLAHKCYTAQPRTWEKKKLLAIGGQLNSENTTMLPKQMIASRGTKLRTPAVTASLVELAAGKPASTKKFRKASATTEKYKQ